MYTTNHLYSQFITRFFASIKPLVFPLVLLIGGITQAQYLQIDDSYTAQQLVEEFIGVENLDCLQISNASVSGYNFGGGQMSYGYFSGAGTTFPINHGVVLSTGKARSAKGPNSHILSEGPAGNAWPGDQDLEMAIQLGYTINATVLEFDFISSTNHVSFEYIFASEQYLTSISSSSQCGYTDGFAFLIKQSNTNQQYTNLAVVPGTSIPVTVNTVRGYGVCPSANEQYFGSFNEEDAPINFNGQTVVMTAQTDIEPGVMYHIKLVIADQGNNLYDSAVFLKGGSFGVGTKDLGQNRLVATGNPMCEGQTLELDATTPNAVQYTWYKDGVEILGATDPIYVVTQAGDYQVAINFTAGDCALRGEVRVEYTPSPIVANTTLVQCENNTGNLTYDLTLANSSIVPNPEQFSFTYFTSLQNANNNYQPITTPEQYPSAGANQIIYARVTNNFGCYSIAEILLSSTNSSLTNPTDLASCLNENNQAVFDLTQDEVTILDQFSDPITLVYFASLEDAAANTNAIANPSAYVASQSQSIYVKILQDGNCAGIVWFDLIVHSFDLPSLEQQVIVCQEVPLTLEAPQGYLDYLWSNGETATHIIIDQPGTYWVSFKNEFGCENTMTYIASASGKAHIIKIDVKDLQLQENSITVIAEGIGDYEYSLNGIEYQDSNYFDNVPNGSYFIHVRDKNGCGIDAYPTYVLAYPKFFTPNGDGVNDTWRIPALEIKDPAAYIQIFDRYGKLIYTFKAADQGWDGTFGSENLPASDYWFVIHLYDRKLQGHFSLKR